MEIETSSGSPLRVSGPVTLEQTPSGRESLRAALAGSADVRLDLSESGPWDVAGLQLLLSALKTSRGLMLDGLPTMLAEVAESAGTLDMLNERIS